MIRRACACLLGLASAVAPLVAYAQGAQGDLATGIAGTAESTLEALRGIDIGETIELLEKLPSGADVKVRLEKVGAAERTVYGAAGTAEMTAAFLLRGNAKAGVAVSRASQEISSKIIGAGPAVNPRVTNRLLRKLGKPGQVISLLSNLGALKGLMSAQRLGRVGRNLGSMGRFSTRQILYGHGAYSTFVATTGQKVRLNIEFVGDAPEAPVLSEPGDTPPEPTSVVTAPEASSVATTTVRAIEDAAAATTAPVLAPVALVPIEDDPPEPPASVVTIMGTDDIDADDIPEPASLPVSEWEPESPAPATLPGTPGGTTLESEARLLELADELQRLIREAEAAARCATPAGCAI